MKYKNTTKKSQTDTLSNRLHYKTNTLTQSHMPVYSTVTLLIQSWENGQRVSLGLPNIQNGTHGAEKLTIYLLFLLSEHICSTK